MSIAHSWPERSGTRTTSALAALLYPLAGAGRLVGRIGAAWRQRADLMQIESLPDDLRKDIGWPDGGRSR
jgi:hypothetical protein